MAKAKKTVKKTKKASKKKPVPVSVEKVEREEVPLVTRKFEDLQKLSDELAAEAAKDLEPAVTYSVEPSVAAGFVARNATALKVAAGLLALVALVAVLT